MRKQKGTSWEETLSVHTCVLFDHVGSNTLKTNCIGSASGGLSRLLAVQCSRKYRI